MHTFVAYYFAYVRKRPRSKEDLLTTVFPQVASARKFAERNGGSIQEGFTAVLTNRDRHFASTMEFRDAARRAQEIGGGLLLADLQGLLSATHPNKVQEAVSAAYSQCKTIFDARTGGEPTQDEVQLMVARAIAVGLERRRPILMGLAHSRTRERASGQKSRSDNQIKAAHGAKLRAQFRAERHRATVEGLMAELPEGASASPGWLARALNERAIFTERGAAWSRASAAKLLERLGLKGGRPD